MDELIDENTIMIIEKNEKICIYTNNEIIKSKKNLLKIIDDSCRKYGNTLAGRIEATKLLINGCYKPPIIISENKNIIFFPLVSRKKKTKMWISYNNLLKYEKFNNETIIYFSLIKPIIISIPYSIFESQIFKCLKLEKNYKKMLENI